MDKDKTHYFIMLEDVGHLERGWIVHHRDLVYGRGEDWLEVADVMAKGNDFGRTKVWNGQLSKVSDAEYEELVRYMEEGEIDEEERMKNELLGR